MKKTLIITKFFPPAIGGIENYYMNVCSRLDPASIVVIAENHPLAKEFDDKQKYKIIRTEFFSGKIPPRWRPLKKLIKKIVQAEGIEQIIFGHFHPWCLLGKKIGLPYFIFGHGTDITQIKSNWWQKIAIRKSYRNKLCQKFIANSRYIFDELSRQLGDRSKLEIIYPGVDIAGLTAKIPDLDSKRTLLGLDKNDIVMLSMGRIEKEKNFSAIIKLMPELLLKIPQLKYVIAGDGSQLQNLKDLVQKYDLRYQVIFTGAIPDETPVKALYYQLAHIFITVSTKPEGFGISYLEAAACKTAIIASKFGGSSEAVKDGENGILIDPNNLEEIKSAIIKLATNVPFWTKMSKSGESWVKQFDWSSQIDKLKKLL